MKGSSLRHVDECLRPAYPSARPHQIRGQRKQSRPWNENARALTEGIPPLAISPNCVTLAPLYSGRHSASLVFAAKPEHARPLIERSPS
jgi:hypothetical protein